MKADRVFIIGNGVGGITAAAELRKRRSDPTDLEITVFTREPYDYYSRIRLPEVFDSGSDITDLTVHPSRWYESRAVRVLRNTDIEKIHRTAHELEVRDGSRYTYDKLLLATGADPLIPEVPGIGLAGVFPVRSFDDAETIRDWVGKTGGEIVVLGGGLLGLETARHLNGSGNVTVLEIAPRLLPRQLDVTGSGILESGLRKQGMHFVSGAEVVRMHGSERVEAVELRDGSLYRADCVVICMGIRPRVSLAQNAGLDVNRGIIVDRFMRTTDHDIFAVGDAAEFNGTVQGIVPAAMEQARIAAANILAEESLSYLPSTPRTTLKVAGISLTSMGEVSCDSRECDVLTILDPAKGIYEKIILKNGRVSGAILLGDAANLSRISAIMGKMTDRHAIEGMIRIPEGASAAWNDELPLPDPVVYR